MMSNNKKDVIQSEFNKKFLTIDEQIELIKKRGLIVASEERLEYYLRNISYYHLAIYAKYFQKEDNNFRDGASFDDVLNLYEFDKKLRLLLLDVLERIEMSLKFVLIYELSQNDVFWFSDKNNFVFTKEGDERTFDNILLQVKNSSEVCIKHFYEDYKDLDYPPAWAFFEVLSFGQCVRISKFLNNENKMEISRVYSLPYETNIKWLSCLSYLRNICAHHSRLWNRDMTYRTAKPPLDYRPFFENVYSNRLYSYLLVIQIYLNKINPNSTWVDRLESLINEHKIPVEKMGFPKNWKKDFAELKNKS